MDPQLSRGPGLFAACPTACPIVSDRYCRQWAAPPEKSLDLARRQILTICPSVGVGRTSERRIPCDQHVIGKLPEIAVQLAGLLLLRRRTVLADVTALGWGYVDSNHPHDFLLSFDGTPRRRQSRSTCNAVHPPAGP